MRAMQKLGLAVSAFFSLTSLSACGGSGGGTAATGGATTTAIQQGAIQKFGSIFVNGVEIKTAGARLHLPDDSANPEIQLPQNELEVQNHLKVGMVVKVKDVIDDNGQHHATEIEFRDNLTGVVDDKGTDFITVMGQKVVVDDKSLLSSIQVGDRVKVSGLPDDKGMLHASHLEARDANEQLEVKGFVGDLSATGFTLLMTPTATSGITVTLGSGLVLPTGLKNGDFVEVKTSTSGASIVATKVELEDSQIKGAENEGMEMEGFIGDMSNFASLNQLTLSNGQVIELQGSTLFVGGTKADLALGMKIEAEGAFSGGILMASKIIFKDNVRINANVTAVDTSAQTISLLGLTVSYSSSTDFKNGNTTVDPATLTGSNVEIRGLFSSTGIIATRIDVKNSAPSGKAFIRGPVSATTSTSITIAGLPLDISLANFSDSSEQSLTAAAFFAALQLNVTVVKATWNSFNGDPSSPVSSLELDN